MLRPTVLRANRAKADRAKANRLGLVLVGLTLTAVGGACLAAGLGLLPRSWVWPTEPLVNAPVVGFFERSADWVWWLIAAKAAITAVLGLRWLFLQRRDSLGGFEVERGPDGATTVSSGALTGVLDSDLNASALIERARTSLAGTSAHPRIRVRITVDERVPISTLIAELGEWTIPRMRHALGGTELTTVVQVGFTQRRVT